jgi:hypothetical protein
VNGHDGLFEHHHHQLGGQGHMGGQGQLGDPLPGGRPFSNGSQGSRESDLESKLSTGNNESSCSSHEELDLPGLALTRSFLPSLHKEVSDTL